MSWKQMRQIWIKAGYPSPLSLPNERAQFSSILKELRDYLRRRTSMFLLDINVWLAMAFEAHGHHKPHVSGSIQPAISEELLFGLENATEKKKISMRPLSL
jgi:hypothetical protein